MFEALERCGLRARLLPELQEIPAAFSGSTAVRFARLAWPLSEAQVEALGERLRIPNEVRELALLACRNRERLRNARAAAPAQLLELLKGTDAFRRPDRFRDLLDVARQASPETEVSKLEHALRAAAAVDAGAIAQRTSGADIPRLIDEARVRAIAAAGA